MCIAVHMDKYPVKVYNKTGFEFVYVSTYVAIIIANDFATIALCYNYPQYTLATQFKYACKI